MKHLSLRDVMVSMSITNNSDGYEVMNAAGSAQYDAWGLRTTVNGIPEYFPLKISAPGVLAGNADSEHSNDHRRHSLWHSTNNVQQNVNHMPDGDVDRELRENFTRPGSG
ncbi:hypothetical protein MUN35_10515 [Hafnia paralvei]|uniref:hypothetical protein n=1 Tax=Hafnia paralvei TaxID=546367 RepID=UPI001FFFE739|nr:hypothetical protein [Hafnia paralvei]MCK2180133.1 hypothetical protein [Hafnia paralvei]